MAMSNKDLADLVSALKADSVLRKALNEADSLETAASIVKQAGYPVNSADLMSFLQHEGLHLDDTALENVAGGRDDTSGAGVTCGGKATCRDMWGEPCGG